MRTKPRSIGSTLVLSLFAVMLFFHAVGLLMDDQIVQRGTAIPAKVITVERVARRSAAEIRFTAADGKTACVERLDVDHDTKPDTEMPVVVRTPPCGGPLQADRGRSYLIAFAGVIVVLLLAWRA